MIFVVIRMVSGFIGAAAIGFSAYRVLRYFRFKGAIQLGVFLAASAFSNLVIAYISLETIMSGTNIALSFRGVLFLIAQIIESITALGFASFILDIFGERDIHEKKNNN